MPYTATPDALPRCRRRTAACDIYAIYKRHAEARRMTSPAPVADSGLLAMVAFRRRSVIFWRQSGDIGFEVLEPGGQHRRRRKLLLCAGKLKPALLARPDASILVAKFHRLFPFRSGLAAAASRF